MELTKDQAQFKQNVKDLLKGTKIFLSMVMNDKVVGDIQKPNINRRPVNLRLTALEMADNLADLDLMMGEANLRSALPYYKARAESLVSLPTYIDEDTKIAHETDEDKVFDTLCLYVSATLRVLDISDKEFVDLLVSKNINYGNSFDKVVDRYGAVS